MKYILYGIVYSLLCVLAILLVVGIFIFNLLWEFNVKKSIVIYHEILNELKGTKVNALMQDPHIRIVFIYGIIVIILFTSLHLFP